MSVLFINPLPKSSSACSSMNRDKITRKPHRNPRTESPGIHKSQTSANGLWPFHVLVCYIFAVIVLCWLGKEEKVRVVCPRGWTVSGPVTSAAFTPDIKRFNACSSF